MFNLVEGIVDHHILSIHHVRDDVVDPMWWDLGFLAFGVILMTAGLALWRNDWANTSAARRTVRGRPDAGHVE